MAGGVQLLVLFCVQICCVFWTIFSFFFFFWENPLPEFPRVFVGLFQNWVFFNCLLVIVVFIFLFIFAFFWSGSRFWVLSIWFIEGFLSILDSVCRNCFSRVDSFSFIIFLIRAFFFGKKNKREKTKKNCFAWNWRHEFQKYGGVLAVLYESTCKSSNKALAFCGHSL